MASDTESQSTSKTLKVGDAAPDFTLKAANGEMAGKEVTLGAFHGQKNVVLAFFPWAFSRTCSAQMPSYQAELDRFNRYDTQVLGISMDAAHSLRAWAEQLGITYPLLSDFYPQGHVTDLYGVRHASGMPERALFVVDKHGTLAWVHVHRPLGEAPDNEDLFEVLRKLG